jgi:hypothetical protein
MGDMHISNLQHGPVGYQVTFQHVGVRALGVRGK